MAVVNRTPDSFFDRGRTFDVNEAMQAVDVAVDAGAPIIDIGGVKAGPGDDVDVDRRAGSHGRVRRGGARRLPGCRDQRRYVAHEVGDAVCRAGADLLNDAWGGYDPELVHVAAEHGVGVVCTHTGWRDTAHPPAPRPVRRCGRLGPGDSSRRKPARAEAAGVDPHPHRDRPRTRLRQEHAALARGDTAARSTRGQPVRPVLVSLSNKDFVGETLDAPVDERLIGTLAATAVSAWLGARVFRAHQVRRDNAGADDGACARGNSRSQRWRGGGWRRECGRARPTCSSRAACDERGKSATQRAPRTPSTIVGSCHSATDVPTDVGRPSSRRGRPRGLGRP